MEEDKKLTIKQLKWLDKYIELGNATEAAMQVYDCKDRGSANAIGSENLAKLSIRDLLEKKGLTLNRILEKVDKGMDATKPISALVLVNTEKGTSRTKENEGQIEVEDFAVQHKFTETALKLHGLLNQKLDANIDADIHITLTRGE